MNKELKNKIKFKALNWYCHDVTYGLPLKWVDGAIKKMVVEKSDSPTERLKELIDLVIDETEISILSAKKETNSTNEEK